MISYYVQRAANLSVDTDKQVTLFNELVEAEINDRLYSCPEVTDTMRNTCRKEVKQEIYGIYSAKVRKTSFWSRLLDR